MQKKITNKERFFNNINLTVDDNVYVAIDVHKNTRHRAGQNEVEQPLLFANIADGKHYRPA